MHIKSLEAVLNKKNFKYDDLFYDTDLTFSWRSFFDHMSHEWSHLTDEDRAKILQTIVKHDINLQILIRAYQGQYIESGRNDIAGAVEGSLAKIVTFLVR